MVIIPRQAQVFGCGERLFANVRKGKPRHAMRRARHVQHASLDRNIARLAGRVAGMLAHALSSAALAEASGGTSHIVRPAIFPAGNRCGIQPQHDRVLGDLTDEGDEQRAVKSALVEIIGCYVGCRDHHCAEFEEAGEQPAEDIASAISVT